MGSMERGDNPKCRYFAYAQKRDKADNNEISYKTKRQERIG